LPFAARAAGVNPTPLAGTGPNMQEQKGRERRSQPRYQADLACEITLPAAERDILFPNERLECRTRDLSESGVGLVAPSIYLGYACVVDEGRAVELALHLPSATVRMKATAAHYVRLSGGDEEGASYVVGLRILEVDEGDRAAFAAFLDALAREQ
jgi:c-di-GMP-binding flagellar brake protein YcgR